MKNIILSAVLLIFGFNFAVSSAVVNQSDIEFSTKNESGIFDEDYLFIGKTLAFSGETEDLVFFGKTLDFTGKTKLGLIALGKGIVISDSVGNGIITGCKDLVIEGNITGTNFIGCKKLVISKNAKITGDLFAGCGDITIDGNIDGDLYIGAGKIDINSEINGDVKIYGGRISISENAQINGNLTYGTKVKLSDAELARISGSVLYDESKKYADAKFPVLFKIIFKLLLTLSFVIVGVLLLFLPVFKKIETSPTDRTFWHTALWGLIPIFMYPAVVVLSLIMIITIPFGIILLFASLPLFYISFIIGATMVGKFVVKKMKWDIQKRHYHFFIGALISAILSIIPVIDFFTALLFSSLGWGVYLSFLFKKKSGNDKIKNQ